MKNEQVYESLKKYAAMLAADGYIECGYIADKADDGLYITTPTRISRTSARNRSRLSRISPWKSWKAISAPRRCCSYAR